MWKDLRARWFAAGVAVTLAIQFVLPDSHYATLSREGVQWLVRVNPWTGSVEWLASTVPTLKNGPPMDKRPTPSPAPLPSAAH